MPPQASEHHAVRCLDIDEDDEVKEDPLRSWVEQAGNLSGQKL